MKEQPEPQRSRCTMRELIVAMKGRWQQEELDLLSKDEYVLLQKTDSGGVVIQLTGLGLQKVREMLVVQE